jgi:hypothetical protein
MNTLNFHLCTHFPNCLSTTLQEFSSVRKILRKKQQAYSTVYIEPQRQVFMIFTPYTVLLKLWVILANAGHKQLLPSQKADPDPGPQWFLSPFLSSSGSFWDPPLLQLEHIAQGVNESMEVWGWGGDKTYSAPAVVLKMWSCRETMGP